MIDLAATSIEHLNPQKIYMECADSKINIFCIETITHPLLKKICSVASRYFEEIQNLIKLYNDLIDFQQNSTSHSILKIFATTNFINISINDRKIASIEFDIKAIDKVLKFVRLFNLAISNRSFDEVISFAEKNDLDDFMTNILLSNELSTYITTFIFSSVKRLYLSADRQKDSTKILEGHGEYIVFQKSSDEEINPVSDEIYQKVYKILRYYSPKAIIDRREEIPSSLYEKIKTEIKKIDPKLEIVFIPQTLYELLLIRKSIEEEMTIECPNISSNPNHTLTDRLSYAKGRKCWHLCCYDGTNEEDYAKGAEILAYQLNRAFVKKLSLLPEGLTLHEIKNLVEEQIRFLSIHCQILPSEFKIFLKSGLSSSFSYPMTELTVYNKRDMDIIRKCIDIECSEIARKSFLLYRGACFQNDALSDIKSEHTLSFGTSLFAGCFYDIKATAFHYMKRKFEDAFIISIPFEKLPESIFHIPTTNTFLQLTGFGEIFHARTKASKDVDFSNITGIFLVEITVDQIEHLRSHLDLTSLIDQFNNYYKKHIHIMEESKTELKITFKINFQGIKAQQIFSRTIDFPDNLCSQLSFLS